MVSFFNHDKNSFRFEKLLRAICFKLLATGFIITSPTCQHMQHCWLGYHFSCSKKSQT